MGNLVFGSSKALRIFYMRSRVCNFVWGLHWKYYCAVPIRSYTGLRSLVSHWNKQWQTTTNEIFTSIRTTYRGYQRKRILVNIQLQTVEPVALLFSLLKSLFLIALHEWNWRRAAAIVPDDPRRRLNTSNLWIRSCPTWLPQVEMKRIGILRYELPDDDHSHVNCNFTC